MSEKFKDTYRIASNKWLFWDYSKPASYFITVCTHNRACMLGEVKGGHMVLSAYGQTV